MSSVSASSASSSSTQSSSFPASSSSATPTGPSCINGPPCATPPPATLYLYTFLSTLIILLVVSGGIITRSFFLRRRQQIAMANGTWVPPSPNRRESRYTLRPKPVIFDVHIPPEAEAGTKEDPDERWGTIQPFSVSDLDIASGKSTPGPSDEDAPPSTRTRRETGARIRARLLTLLRLRLHRPFRHAPAASDPVAVPALELIPPLAAAAPDPAPSPSNSHLRVSVLVVMPTPPASSSASTADDEEELPHLELGVLEADVIDSGRNSSQSGSGIEEDTK
ncbi:hypothetical protein GGX14DRAFT_696461 [Mycena pura]|uniref:Uncharacterized protein n=1 Tax=Mycena pura TaxID=153505 RepID=A0AAD6VSW6_9AGAR|nr:hypothetical protein GGX14DRAFT_696461 [Mycena pura]